MSSKPQQFQRNGPPLRVVRLLLAFLLLRCGPALGQAVPAHPLETPAQRAAAIASTVIGIISYTHWPADPRPITICAIAKPDHAGSLLANETGAGKAIAVREMGIDDPTLTSACNVLYLGALNEKERLALFASLAGHPILTISETGPACNAGSMFCLRFERNRVGLQMNMDSIARSGVHVDPHVLLLSAPKQKVAE
ncbi:MAG TPA: YfiR family protein [Rudaea sp.]|nr:YfiR family protein [Rudaea sp.]